MATEVRQIIPNIHLLILFDILKYLAKGRHIGKAKELLGSVLNMKPLLSIKDGELVPTGQVRTRYKGIQRLFEAVKNTIGIQDLSIVYSTTPDEAQKQLQVNRTKTVPQTKHEYLLRGHLRCRHCGQTYVGGNTSRHLQNGKRYVHRYYRCTGKLRMNAPLEHCHNKDWQAEAKTLGAKDFILISSLL